MIDESEHTFKYEQTENNGGWIIYTGREKDRTYIVTPTIAWSNSDCWFNFDTEKEANAFCNKLNKIADNTKHNFSRC